MLTGKRTTVPGAQATLSRPLPGGHAQSLNSQIPVSQSTQWIDQVQP